MYFTKIQTRTAAIKQSTVVRIDLILIPKIFFFMVSPFVAEDVLKLLVVLSSFLGLLARANELFGKEAP